MGSARPGTRVGAGVERGGDPVRQGGAGLAQAAASTAAITCWSGRISQTSPFISTPSWRRSASRPLGVAMGADRHATQQGVVGGRLRDVRYGVAEDQGGEPGAEQLVQ